MPRPDQDSQTVRSEGELLPPDPRSHPHSALIGPAGTNRLRPCRVRRTQVPPLRVPGLQRASQRPTPEAPRADCPGKQVRVELHPLASGWRLARRRIMGADRAETPEPGEPTEH